MKFDTKKMPNPLIFITNYLNDNNLVYSFTPDMRRASLQKLLNIKNFLIFMEAHSPLSALIIDKKLQ